MRLRLGRPRVALIVAPHPDDEVIGAYGLMRRLRGRGVRVRVLVVTDGAGSHPSSGRWPSTRLVRQRRREALWGLRTLGIRAGAVRFLGLPDGGLPGCEQRAAGRILGAARGLRDLDLVVGPDLDDDHADHRVTAAALRRLPRRVRSLSYPVWPADRAVCGARTLPVLGGALAKRAALRLHRSQIGGVGDDPSGFHMTAAQVAGFSRPVESFVELRR